jgi:hypothetical protein
MTQMANGLPPQNSARLSVVDEWMRRKLNYLVHGNFSTTLWPKAHETVAESQFDPSPPKMNQACI